MEPEDRCGEKFNLLLLRKAVRTLEQKLLNIYEESFSHMEHLFFILVTETKIESYCLGTSIDKK